MAQLWPNAHNIALSNHPPGLTFQDVHGRIPHQIQLAEDVDPSNGEHRDLTLMRRAIETMGIDVQIVFPQPMLDRAAPVGGDRDAADLCLQPLVHQPHPGARAAHQVDAGAAIRQPGGVRLRTIDEFAGKPGVIGFLVTGQRQVGVYGPRACRSIAPRGARPPARLPRRAGLQHRPAAQPVRVGASLSFVTQHDSPHELDNERAERVPEVEGDLDRERPRLAAVHDAASRPRVSDAPVGRAAAAEAAERACRTCITRRSRWNGRT